MVQPLHVGQHDVVELAALIVRDRPGLQRVQIQADRRQRSLELVG
jgi:hypothetical protein